MTFADSPLRASFSIDSLAEKYEASFPGYDLIHFFEAGFPVFKVNLRVSMLLERALPLVSEFMLKLMDADVRTVEEIAQWFGIPENQVFSHAADLIRGEYISQHAQGLLLTEKGRRALNSLKMKVPQTTGLPITVDGMTGEMDGWTNGLYRRDTIKKGGMMALPPYEPRPVESSLSFSKLQALVKKLQRNKIDHVPAGDLIDLVGIQKVYTEYRKMQVLVFQEKNGSDFELLVFDRNYRMREHEQALKRLERSNVRVVPHDNIDNLLVSSAPFQGIDFGAASRVATRLVDIRKEQKILSQRLEVERSFEQRVSSGDESGERISDIDDRLSQLEQELLDIDAAYRTVWPHEQAALLERALLEATDSVILVSPRLDRSDREHILGLFEKTLERGITVYLGFGDDPGSKQPRAEYEPQTLARLQAITKKPYGSKFIVKHLDTQHERVIIADGQFSVFTPLTLANFQADQQRSIRQEVGVYCGDTTLVSVYCLAQLDRFALLSPSGTVDK